MHPPETLARIIETAGYACVQLALDKAIPGICLDHGFPGPSRIDDIRRSFEHHGIHIAVLGCYIHPIHPNPDVAASLTGRFKDHLRHARDLGCGLVALESGSLNADYSPHPDNAGALAFHRLVDSLGGLVSEAESRGVCVGIEGVCGHVLHTPERMADLLDAIPSPHLKVVFDPVNLINAGNHHDPSGMVHRCMDLFGHRVAAVHLKDFRWQGQAALHLPLGEGGMDHGPVLRWLHSQRPDVPVILEGTGGAPASAFRSHLITGHPASVP